MTLCVSGPFEVDDDGSVRCFDLVFGPDGVRDVAGDDRGTFVSKARIRALSIENRGTRHGAMRQLFWGLAYAVFALVAFWRARAGSIFAVVLGLGLAGLSLLVFRHLLRPVTRVFLTTTSGASELGLGGKLSEEDVRRLARHLREQLGYPVR